MGRHVYGGTTCVWWYDMCMVVRHVYGDATGTVMMIQRGAP